MHKYISYVHICIQTFSCADALTLTARVNASVHAIASKSAVPKILPPLIVCSIRELARFVLLLKGERGRGQIVRSEAVG